MVLMGQGWCRSQAFHPRGFGSNPQLVHPFYQNRPNPSIGYRRFRLP